MGYALQGHRYVPIERQGHCWPSAVLGTLWERGDRHHAEGGSEPYTLMRFRKPGSTEWYPTADETVTELETTKVTLDERGAELEATKAALERAETETERKDELLADPQALLAYYERNFGPLNRGETRS